MRPLWTAIGTVGLFLALAAQAQAASPGFLLNSSTRTVSATTIETCSGCGPNGEDTEFERKRSAVARRQLGLFEQSVGNTDASAEQRSFI
ncbi:MAG: hypothetical protein AAF430_00115 [Myxococcota bacterium]